MFEFVDEADEDVGIHSRKKVELLKEQTILHWN